MELLADRFATTDGGWAIDLATGDPVLVMLKSAAGASDHVQWAARCDTLLKLRHRAVAELVDYGAIGSNERFEAWRCGPPWIGSAAEAEEARRVASTFLRSCGLTPGAASNEAVRHAARGAVVLPDSAAGYPAATTSKTDEKGPLSLDACGFVHHPRRAVAALAELLEPASSLRPRIAALWGPSGSGRSSAALDLARVARLHGSVPVATHLFDQRAVAEAVIGRTLFLIDDQALDGWRVLLEASILSPRPHVLLLAGPHEHATVDGIALDRLSLPVLRSLIRPANISGALDERVRRAAARADGLPGRFVRMLWASSVSKSSMACGTTHGFVAAEQPAVYGIDEPPVDPSPPRSVGQGAWVAPADLMALRKRLDDARRLLSSGKHAPGDRAMRQVIGGLARRGDFRHAGEGAVALSSSLLRRGRAAEAQAVLDQAKNYGCRAKDDLSLVETATLAGLAWMDLGRPDEAENVLGAALAAARAHGGQMPTAHASLALARCAFWRGRYAEADQLLAAPTCAFLQGEITVRAAALESRTAVGLRDLGRAIGRALESVQRAQALGDAGSMAQATYAAAFAHLAAGDLDAVERDVVGCLAATRSCRDPLRAIRARLLLAEGARRRGRRSVVVALLRRLCALAAISLPPIVRARVALLKDLVESSASSVEIVERHVATTGLSALALFVPPNERPTCRGGPFDPALDDVLEILRLCQNAEHESTILSDLCAQLRRQLHAAALGFIARDGNRLVTIASDGPRLEAPVAARAIDAGVPIEPGRCDDRIEAAVPVKYGGATIGALAVRWTFGSPHDLVGVTARLMMAATAAAPVLSAGLAHRARAMHEGPTELMGTSAAVADIRQAIERAARAPFAVLIEGESGSGKELVARALHRCGPRRDRPFCTLNCAALPEDLIEAELFGHARGAFTGAIAERPGVFEEAHGGTLFLDEIAELTLRAQAKLLRVIQEGELRRIGENLSRRVDVRIVAATNRDLRREAAAARFRFDLLYRLDVVRIVVPPLRERREDIAALAEHFWREATARLNSRAALATATLAALARYDWPGNVRELQNVLAALAVRSPKRGVVPPTALPPYVGEHDAADLWRLDEARRTFEEQFVRAALIRAGGHRTRAAAELGITRQGLTKLMARLGIANRGDGPPG